MNNIAKRSVIVLAAVVVVLAIVLATLPAKLAWQWFGDQFRPLQLDDISGTLWSGQAATAVWQDQRLGQLQWRWRVSDPLHWQLQTSFNQQRIDAVMRLGNSQNLYDIHGRWPASSLAPKVPGVSFLGEWQIQIEHLHMVEPLAVDGEMVWEDASLRGHIFADLGKVRVLSQGSELTLQNSGGQMTVLGSGHFDQHGYLLTLRLRARPEAPPSLSESLLQLGQLNPDGSVSIDFSARY